MKKISYLLGTMTIVLSVNAVNAMPQITGDFIGINAAKEHCRAQTDDESFSYMGPAKTKLTMNKNYILASCQAEYNQDEDLMSELDEAMVERAETPCRIAMQNPVPDASPKMIHFEGLGGFSVTPSGYVLGHCKAVKYPV